MLWGIICTVLVVSMMVGPIMLMKPSLSQKRLAAKRQKAIEKGFRVHMAPTPEGVKIDAIPRYISMYCWPLEKKHKQDDSWLLIKKNYTHEIHAAGCWDWSQEPSQSPAIDKILNTLSELPNSVVAIEKNHQGVCCYWEEKGDEQQLENLLNWIKQTAATLCQD